LEKRYGENEQQRGKLPSWVPQALGYALSIACLAWVVHGYDWHDFLQEVRDVDWRWISLGVVFDLAVYVCHGWRWDLVLSPIRRLPFWRTVQAIYIGLFANEILPLRSGELIRGYLLAHWNGMHLSVVLASEAIERLMDGIWMLGAFLLATSFLKLPRGVVDIVRILTVVLALGLVTLIFVVFYSRHAHAIVSESRWASVLRHVIDGLHLMGNWRSLSRALGATFVYMMLQILSYWALLKADQLDLSVWAAAAVFIVVRLATVIPNAPGNLGLLNVACVVALRMFDVEQNVAKSFSIMMFGALTLPLLLGGALAVALTGLNIREIHSHARRGLDRAEQPAAPDDQPPAR
jgi:uncharacterized protein (TIRG00374 family)